MRGKVGESRTLSWEINKRKKKKKELKRRRRRRENVGKWVYNMIADVVQQEHNNNKYYASTFRYIYIYIYI